MDAPPALDGGARYAVHALLTDLLAARLDHLLGDLDAWMVAVEAAGTATIRACSAGAA